MLDNFYPHRWYITSEKAGYISQLGCLSWTSGVLGWLFQVQGFLFCLKGVWCIRTYLIWFLILHNGAFVKKIHDSEPRDGVGSGPFSSWIFYLSCSLLHFWHGDPRRDWQNSNLQRRSDWCFPIADFTAKPQFGGGKGTTIGKETLVPEAGERINECRGVHELPEMWSPERP